MGYYLGVDAGGTKTAFLLTDESGKCIARAQLGSASYAHIGQEGVGQVLKSGVEQLFQRGGVTREPILGAAWGIPCYGENPRFDEWIAAWIPGLLPQASHHICNDVELGLAGSLLLQPGIHLVAGTGAIGLGKNSKGETARANGWHEEFSDEGSAYWLGIQALSLFGRQADGRTEKSALYRIMTEEWRLAKDMDIVPYFIEHLQGRRDKIAQVQLLLCRAAEEGDPEARGLYGQAAHFLYETAVGIYHQLGFSPDSEVLVSYYGGVYKAGERIVEPLREKLKSLPARLVAPALSPVSGGILLAAQLSNHQHMAELEKQLQQQEEMECRTCT